MTTEETTMLDRPTEIEARGMCRRVAQESHERIDAVLDEVRNVDGIREQQASLEAALTSLSEVL